MAGDHPGVPGLGDAPFNAGGRRSARSAPRGDDDEDEAAEDETHGRSLTLASVARDARLDKKFLLLITLSSAIATLGLLQSSAAVVIGAMLVSPLLGPIMGVGFGLATLESNLIKRSLVTMAAGMAVAIIVAMLIIWMSPIQDVTPELRARTQPTLLDLGVAVVGGIAGVYAIMRKLSGVMVGRRDCDRAGAAAVDDRFRSGHRPLRLRAGRGAAVPHQHAGDCVRRDRRSRGSTASGRR